ncbi:hypothetical protein Drorol1_Dr00005449 [Drosera rotundifolia]
MENHGCSSDERACLINELTQGMDVAKQLKAQLGLEISGEAKGILVEQILHAFGKALLILNWNGPTEQPPQVIVPSPALPGSPISYTGSPQSEDLNASFSRFHDSNRDFFKKRKTAPTWTQQVKANLENGVEGAPDDGHNWRKYGQKDILGATYPRSYYRCTYRGTQDCWAIKQVQRSDEDPSIFDITYKGKHTCRTAAPCSQSMPTSPETRVSGLQHLRTAVFRHESNVTTFNAALHLDGQNIDNQVPAIGIGSTNSGNHIFSTTFENINSYSNFNPIYIPSTSDVSYFPVSPCNMEQFGGFQHQRNSESDISDIISATTSGTNSPIVPLDFTPETFNFNQGFPFDHSGLF